MNTEQIEQIKKQAGTIDAAKLIPILEALGVQEDVKINKEGISIPEARVKDFSELQNILIVLSETATWLYELSKQNDHVIINIKSRPRAVTFLGMVGGTQLLATRSFPGEPLSLKWGMIRW